MHGHAHAFLPIETPGGKGRLSIGQRKIGGVRGVDAACAQALRMGLFNGTDFGMLVLAWKLDEPGLEPWRFGRTERSIDGVSIKQRLGPGTLGRASDLQKLLQERTAFTRQHVLNIGRQLVQRNVL